ncbi:putative holin-like toxin [Bacillus sp. AFS017336]|nr:putative holin-like toxin [Bacillus sp. AFS017336]
MVTFEVLSLMISFGMFVIAILEFKEKDRNKDS